MYKINIKEEYDIIEKDIIKNQKEIFNLYNYYTKKYRGNIIFDRNVGLFLNNNQQPVVQIFLRYNKQYIRTHLIFNRLGTEIIDKQVLNLKV